MFHTPTQQGAILLLCILFSVPELLLDAAFFNSPHDNMSVYNLQCADTGLMSVSADLYRCIASENIVLRGTWNLNKMGFF